MSQPLILRCLAEYDGHQWSALCLDYTLAAQADTFEEARAKLEEMICEYIYDALEGEDREYAHQFIARRAPLRDWVRYYYAKLRNKFDNNDKNRPFFEPVPMRPACP